ncbi:hypothetical protein SGFS_060070 [Streptomyces graminofaciens]|uniref:Uncharacterized protein n=1 Tax=Streptomyces graminofaciens TaxID=68212 RepID=A0ABM7FFC0_9ACTN|nr:hypothetical protein [Streptomyces graminofaciens]BBC34713.1 hypothetical protein SGFS_060070 [Streptomyces graminofaciens]
MNIDIGLRTDPGRARGRGFVLFGHIDIDIDIAESAGALSRTIGFTLANGVLAIAKQPSP